MVNKLKKLRKESGLSQAALAKKANTSAQQIHRLENSDRKLTIEWMRVLAVALDVSPASLLPDDFGVDNTQTKGLIHNGQLLSVILQDFFLELECPEELADAFADTIVTGYEVGLRKNVDPQSSRETGLILDFSRHKLSDKGVEPSRHKHLSLTSPQIRTK